MSKCMLTKDGRPIKVSKTEAATLYAAGQARYICKDEYRKLTGSNQQINQVIGRTTKEKV